MMINLERGMSSRLKERLRSKYAVFQSEDTFYDKDTGDFDETHDSVSGADGRGLAVEMQEFSHTWSTLLPTLKIFTVHLPALPPPSSPPCGPLLILFKDDHEAPPIPSSPELDEFPEEDSDDESQPEAELTAEPEPAGQKEPTPEVGVPEPEETQTKEPELEPEMPQPLPPPARIVSKRMPPLLPALPHLSDVALEVMAREKLPPP
jgi:hypothetical protein